MGWSTVGTPYGPVKKGGKMFFSKRKYLMGTTGGGDVSNRFNANGRGPCFCIKNEGITWRTTTYAVC